MRRGIILGLSLSIGLFAAAFVRSEPAILAVENQYIKVFINNSPEETGRLAVDVTGGDPGRSDDNGKPLIYGHPKPWTSFTTLRIDGRDYVFGRSTTKRSGTGLPGGEITDGPKADQNQLIMTCRYGQVSVTQTLDITRSPSTGSWDTARIRYLIQNRGGTATEIGLRALLDTMLGTNDGTPFRIGDREVNYEYSCDSATMPDFWQAFDSLNHPAVIAQGTLKGGEVTTPDRIIFTNWGKAADQPWDFPIKPGTEFLRLGEDELDSAVVMYWNPRRIEPGGQLTVTIDYGLGGITFAPGKTYLGITAPAELNFSNDRQDRGTIVLYLENRGEAKAKNVRIALNLPQGLKLVSGSSRVSLEELLPGLTKQLSWEVQPDGSYQGKANFGIGVSGEGLENNQVTRSLQIVGPPQFHGELTSTAIKVVNNRWDPYPSMLTFHYRNSGATVATGVRAVLNGNNLVEPAEGEVAEKFLDDLAPGASAVVSWRIVPLRGGVTGRIQATLTGNGAAPLSVTADLAIPALSSKVVMVASAPFMQGRPASLDVYCYNLKDAIRFVTDLTYDPAQLRLVYLSRGRFLVEDGKLSAWTGGTIDHSSGRARGIGGTRTGLFDGGAEVLFSLHFMVIGKGAGTIGFDNFKMYNSHGEEVILDQAPFQYRIEEGKL